MGLEMSNEKTLLWVTPTRFGMDMCQTTQIGAAQALVNLGWEVHFVSIKGDLANAPSALNHCRVTELARPHNILSDGLAFNRSLSRSLCDVAAETKPSLALVEWRGSLGFMKANRELKLPWILEDRSPPVRRTLQGHLQWRIYDRAWKKASKAADGWSVITESLATFVQDRFKLDSAPIAIWPSGVDVHRFSPSRVTTPCLVYHGRIDKERDIVSIVEACDHLRKTIPEITLLVCGHGNDEKRLLSLSSQRPWFEFKGPLPPNEIPDVLAQATIGVLPLPDLIEWRHSSPLKLFEYAAAGLEVVATDITAHRVYSERPWMHLYDAADRVTGLAASLEHVIRNQNASRREQARRDAENDFIWQGAVQPLHDALLSLL